MPKSMSSVGPHLLNIQVWNDTVKPVLVDIPKHFIDYNSPRKDGTYETWTDLFSLVGDNSSQILVFLLFNFPTS